ncbi:MAG: cysteine--tRNA ligase [Treponemataceae bacterium]
MALMLYNTMGRKIEEFKPIEKGKAGFYGCGPTVYNYAHIGNLRAYVFLDILDKTLSFLGYEVKHVMNITDVGHLSGDGDDGEDKMVKSAAERHQSVLEIANFYTQAFMKDIDALNIRHPDVICKATEHIQEMIDLIKQIEKNGHTYTAGGNLYYDISTYENYGKLANLNLEQLKEGAGKRALSVIDKNKRNPEDFVLWFTKSKFEDQAMTWDSPWGKGYPGWHIECSAMSMKYLGKHFDIHTGGIDHVPVHHTNEIAQSEGSFDKNETANGPWVNYWLHNEFLILDGGKMSKSNGNFITLQAKLPTEKGCSLKDKGYDPLDYRYFLLGGHYRKQLIFSWEAMDGARSSRLALNQKVSKIIEKTPYIDSTVQLCKISDKNALDSLEEFKSALEKDLATPKALSILNKVIKNENIPDIEKIALIENFDQVFSLSIINEARKIALETQKNAEKQIGNTQNSDPEIEKMIMERNQAKKEKNYGKADEIRNELKAKGIIIIDTPQGTTWKYE